MDYSEFLDKKTHLKHEAGFEPIFMPDFLFDFQKSMVDWSVRKGRAAILEDCGLGKTPQFLVWAQNITMMTNMPVLVLTPLAVAQQVVTEGEKFDIECEQSRNGLFRKNIVVTNYEKLHYFEPSNFAGVVCDESSVLKNFDGKRKAQITDFLKKIKYRLLSTATAAPNDYIELGTSSEALGMLGYMDMLNRFFKNDQNTSDTKRHWVNQSGGGGQRWRFKGHSEQDFWRWVTSWARAIRKPSDLGFDDGKFTLPPLNENQHLIEVSRPPIGELFVRPVQGLKEQREELRQTVTERCEKVAEIVDHDKPFCCWCQYNNEGDLLEKLIPNAVQVAGKHSDEEKEEKLIAFQKGEVQGIVTKPKIAGFGLNFQHCAHTTFFPSHSYEQYYQGVRRFWRFGQEKEVTVDVVTTPGMDSTLKNLQAKAKAADKMFSELVKHMNNSISIEKEDKYINKQEVPAWL